MEVLDTISEGLNTKGEWLIAAIQDLKNTVSEVEPMEHEREYIKNRLEMIEEILVPFVNFSVNDLIIQHKALRKELNLFLIKNNQEISE